MSSFSKQDFTNAAEVKWCPGCGDYAILNALQRVLPLLEIPPEKHAFISGIGCAGRLPYYMNTYGFHTIHGRALTAATGLKAMRPDLSVWVIMGDGDALSIGGNHFIHALRRNVNLTILMLNNQVYGLTKGQYSPTSPQGQITKTSPHGVEQMPFNPLTLALSAGASFVARAVDKDPVHLASILQAAHEHEGASFVEIYQDCHIFNNGAFDAFSTKTNRQTHALMLEAQKPLCFGESDEWIISENKEGAFEKASASATAQPLKHKTDDFMHAMRLARLSFPEFPVPLGIYYQTKQACFNLPLTQNKGLPDLHQLYRSRGTWEE